MILSKKSLFVLKILIGILVIFFITLNFLVKKNINSLSNSRYLSSCGIVYYDFLNNSYNIKNLSIKSIENNSSYFFNNVKIKMNILSIFDEIIEINTLEFINGKIIFHNQKNINNLSINNNSKKLDINQINVINNNLFKINRINVQTDIYYINKIKNINFKCYSIMDGRNICNIDGSEWGNVQIISQMYTNKEIFNSQLNIDISPLCNIDHLSFKLNGSIENIPAVLTDHLLKKIKIAYSSASINPNISCLDGMLYDSAIIVRINDIDIIKDSYETKIKKIQLPIIVHGSLRDIKLDYTPSLTILKNKTLGNTIKILSDKIEEEYDRVEDQVKLKLKKVDEKFDISEIDEKLKEEYDRVEDQAKEKLKEIKYELFNNE